MTRLSAVDICALRPQCVPPTSCPPELRVRLQSLGVWASPTASPGSARPRRRGCRAGRRVQLRRTVNTPAVSVSKLPTENPEVTFSCLNVRLLHSKIDDVLEIIRDRRVDIFCLTETWHDSDSACIGRLRTSGFIVADRPRFRVRDDLSTNHGGVAIVSNDSICMSPVAVTPASTFEHVAVCIASGQFACIVVTLYRPGSVKLQQRFFEELASLLEHLAYLHYWRFQYSS